MNDLLKSKRHDERRSALETTLREIGERQQRAEQAFRDQFAAANARAAEETSAAKQAVDDAAAALDHALATEFVGALYPLVAVFPDKPRSTVGAISEVCKRFTERAREELGEPLHDRFLAFAFARLHGLEAIAGTRSFWEGESMLSASARAMKAAIASGELAPEIEAALRDLELVVVRRARHAHPESRSTVRAEIMERHATSRLLNQALQEHDAAEERAANERRIAEANETMAKSPVVRSSAQSRVESLAADAEYARGLYGGDARDRKPTI